MRIVSRLVCALVGHQPSGGQATYDTAAESFVDVATTQYTVCARCGDVRPAPLTVADGASAGGRAARTSDQSSEDDETTEGSEANDGEGDDGEGDEREPTESEREGHTREEGDADGDRAVSTTR